ncbi:MAG: hypothetical protein NTW85_06460 [Methylococcales bacterium]|nr:hypothetical protein [Methylococcales bacterium]
MKNHLNKAELAKHKARERQKNCQAMYYQQGYQAGYINKADLEPHRANHNNRAEWLRGFNAGKMDAEQVKLRKSLKTALPNRQRIKALLTMLES